MKFNFEKNDGILNVSLEGRLDAVNAPEFDSFLGNNMADAAALHINCEKLEYISSAGLRVLLSAHKKKKGAMKLSHVQELVMEVLELTGFADILEIV
jgi:anti-sigma B factor antagonist